MRFCKRLIRVYLELMSDNTSIERLYNGLNQVFRGNKDVLEKTIAAFITGGHILIEDMPGTGKTTIGRTFAKLIEGAEFKRIQFTPDLLPYDITGMEVWDEERRDFVFRPGPVFADIVLADEINRTTPKVQSALLEAMAESQVTVGNHTHPLSMPFLVIATQNPVETEGTYPLPAAQKDRFMLLLHPGYPDRETEYLIVANNPSRETLPSLKPVCTVDEIRALQQSAREVHVDNRIIRCAVDIAVALRDHPDTAFGVSTRGVLMLVDAMRGLALIRGRDYVIDQDIADLAVETYAHRIRLRSGTSQAESIVEDFAAREIRRIRHG